MESLSQVESPNPELNYDQIDEIRQFVQFVRAMPDETFNSQFNVAFGEFGPEVPNENNILGSVNQLFKWLILHTKETEPLELVKSKFGELEEGDPTRNWRRIARNDSDVIIGWLDIATKHNIFKLPISAMTGYQFKEYLTYLKFLEPS